MEFVAQRDVSPKSRRTLGYILLIASGFLVGLQIVILLSSPWVQSVTYDGWFGPKREWTLNPLIIWLPIYTSVFTVIWISACFKTAEKKMRFLLLSFLICSVVFTVVGFSLSPPWVIAAASGKGPIYRSLPPGNTAIEFKF